MTTGLFTACLSIAILSLIPLIRSDVYWIRALDFPRPQLAAISVLLVVAAILVTDHREGLAVATWLIGGLCAIYNGWFILPYSRLYPETAPGVSNYDPGDKIAVMVANVLQTNRDASTLIEIVGEQDPDVIAILESDHWWQQQLEALHLAYPHRLNCPQDNLYGMHLYSKLPLRESSIEFLVQDSVPSMHALLTLPCGDDVRLHALHPAPPAPDENDTSQPRDAELIATAKNVSDFEDPVIVLGDLNDPPWTATVRLFLKVSGLLDPRVGRGLLSTFNARHRLIRWPLDHVFHSPHFSVLDIRRSRSFGSDHFALIVELVLNRPGALPPRADRADGEELNRAGEKIRQEQVSAGDVPEPGNGHS